tara:strand:+ start:14369 stop:14977 length:609 start_codon:yes stop_codon:yes gene_type:complete
MNIDLVEHIQNEKALKVKKFDQENPGLIDALREIVSWNSFAASLVNQYDSRGTLSEKQTGAAIAMLMKISKNGKKTLDSVDYRKVKEVLDNAFSDGINNPKLRFGDIVLSRAGDNGVNKGAVYIKVDGEYAGKLHGGYFLPIKMNQLWRQETFKRLKVILNDPLEQAVAYGRKFGSCCACGRTLTNHASIEAGIGPICGSRF